MKRITAVLVGVVLSIVLNSLSLSKKARADFIYPVIGFQEKQSQTNSSNTTPHKQKKEFTPPEKNYNWIKPDKHDKWQCAYELTYDEDTPDGFKLYVDRDGDNKPDYTYEYYLNGINAFYGGATYEFRLKTSVVPVGGGWKDNGYKAMNVCGPDAIKDLFYKRDDLVRSPYEYEIDEVDYDFYYPEVTFERR
ncbi:hypothetical protein [Phorcysia thermohydrogeniphila]|uniref:Uncharacterized protein n=1 Tax=Phorcysia thermohydrogeniphila TaxID=936138 RepID=A0A4R1GIG1_9BACT|nr:hypothetical protein [Phorcysia thermohydrogeniphila]TCK04042.1 hypothetical protein CLV27_1360 [Phorcysia thermohydrogeniphila]